MKLTFPKSPLPDATVGWAVQSNRFIRRRHAKTSFAIALAADKRYSLGRTTNPSILGTSMAKPKIQNWPQIVPSSLEEHLGEVWDPRGHTEEIRMANEFLCRFVSDMENGLVPEITLDVVRQAVDTLGKYSGYPDDAYGMEIFLYSPLASSSYRTVARMLPSFMQDMNALIIARNRILDAQTSDEIAHKPEQINDEDLPF